MQTNGPKDESASGFDFFNDEPYGLEATSGLGTTNAHGRNDGEIESRPLTGSLPASAVSGSKPVSVPGQAGSSTVGKSAEIVTVSVEIGDPNDEEMDFYERQRLLYQMKLENVGVYDFLGIEFNVIPQDGGIKLDPGLGREIVSKQGNVAAFVTLVKSFVGIGILTLPFCMRMGGYIGGPTGLILLALGAEKCMQNLLSTSKAVKTHGPPEERNQPLSFGGLGMKVCGIWAKRTVDGSLIVTQFGFCIAYVIFIAENVSGVICTDTHEKMCPSKYTVAFFTCCILCPFSFLRSMKTLVIPTLLANVALFGGISWGYVSAFHHGFYEGSLTLEAWPLTTYPLFFGIGVFSFEGVGMLLPIHHVMQEPDQLPRLLRIAMCFIGSLMISFGLVCYIAYGDKTDAMITVNFPASKLTSFVRLFYALGVLFTYPIMMFPVFNLLEGAFPFMTTGTQHQQDMKRFGFRFIVVNISGIIAVSIPHFGLFLGLVGSVCCTLLSFILPSLFHYLRPGKPTGNGLTLSDKFDIFMIIFGIFGGAISFSITMNEFLST